MKTAGIIAEYNPFHNGHAYHILETRKRTGADYVVVVMSPDFVQRGEPAISDKWSRARSALEAGADLVIQLPVWSATGSAEYFAEGGVELLNKLGVVDYLSFGCESKTPDLLSQAADFFSTAHEPEDYQTLLRDQLRAGKTFAEARAEAFLKNILKGQTHTGDLNIFQDMMMSPNNILAIEYEKALLKSQSSIRPLAMTRIGNDYKDEKLSSGSYSSATAIRRLLRSLSSENNDPAGAPDPAADPLQAEAAAAVSSEELLQSLKQQLSSCMPKESVMKLLEDMRSGSLLFPKDLDLPMRMKLLDYCSGNLPYNYQDLNRELSDRIRNQLDEYRSFEQFVSVLNTKQMTESRVRRALIHILLGIRSEDLEEYREHGCASYIRVLGFKKSSQPLLHAIQENSSLPIITKLAGCERLLDSTGRKMMRTDLYAAALRSHLVSQKNASPVQNEYTKQLVILP